MKTVTVGKVEPTNPVFRDYVKTAKSWDKENKIKIKKDDKILPFYAIYLDGLFLAASTIEFDREASSAKVAMINNSINYYEEIQAEASQKILDMLVNDYKAEEVEFSYVKRA